MKVLSPLPYLLFLLTAVALTACGGSSATSTPASSLSVGVLSSDLAVGPNRVAFFLLDSVTGPIVASEINITAFFAGGSGEKYPEQSSRAVFRRWPVGGLGIYTAQLEFDRAGAWSLRATTDGPEGTTRTAEDAFDVKETSSTPAIGSLAPRSRNRTARDVPSLDQLTTDSSPDWELYAMTIDEAVRSGLALIVTFATPAFCETATCGPQLDVIGELKDTYRGRANFLHVEVYDNPHEIQSDLSNAVVSPTVGEWGLPSEPWTFVIDETGRVAAKFEAFTTAPEIEDALLAVLR